MENNARVRNVEDSDGEKDSRIREEFARRYSSIDLFCSGFSLIHDIGNTFSILWLSSVIFEHSTSRDSCSRWRKTFLAVSRLRVSHFIEELIAKVETHE